MCNLYKYIALARQDFSLITNFHPPLMGTLENSKEMRNSLGYAVTFPSLMSITLSTEKYSANISLQVWHDSLVFLSNNLTNQR